MKANYTSPEMEILQFSEDIITSSGVGTDSNELPLYRMDEDSFGDSLS